MAVNAEPEAGIEVRKRHPLIGAEVRGLDLGQPLDDATVDRLHALWMAHLLLIFPDQPISDSEQVAFGRRFGALEIHPSLANRASRNREIYRVTNVDERGKLIPPDNSTWQYVNQSWLWHTDSSFRDVPSKGSILHGIEITKEGGNTRFANMYAAYAALSGRMKARIEGLRAVHDHEQIIKLSPGLSKKRDQGTYAAMPPVRHPLVHLHPVTGRRSLLLSPHTMTGIDGMAEDAGRALLDELTAHATREEFVYRHVWAKDDIVMWDNRCTMHAAEPFDNVRERRIMHRVTLAGEGRLVPAG